MPKRTNPLQKAVMYLESLKSDNISVSESAMLIDKGTGAEREVDILVEGEVNGHEIKVAIEVRDHKRAADIAWVEQIYIKHRELSTNKLVLVSGSGFTKNAKTKAIDWGIDIVDVSQDLGDFRSVMRNITSVDFIEIKAYCLFGDDCLPGDMIINEDTDPETINEFVLSITQLKEIQEQALQYMGAGEESMAIVFPETTIETNNIKEPSELTVVLKWGENKNVPATMSQINYQGAKYFYMEYGDLDEYFHMSVLD